MAPGLAQEGQAFGRPAFPQPCGRRSARGPARGLGAGVGTHRAAAQLSPTPAARALGTRWEEGESRAGLSRAQSLRTSRAPSEQLAPAYPACAGPADSPRRSAAAASDARDVSRHAGVGGGEGGSEGRGCAGAPPPARVSEAAPRLPMAPQLNARWEAQSASAPSPAWGRDCFRGPGEGRGGRPRGFSPRGVGKAPDAQADAARD